jgi:hypothetical protein
MKTAFCHYCALCGNLNDGPRSFESRCGNCTRSTYIQCPECNEPLHGKQFRCSCCHKQFSWHNAKAIPIKSGSKNQSDKNAAYFRIQSLLPAYAKQIVYQTNKKLRKELVISRQSALSTGLFTELAKFGGELHLPDVMTLEPLGTYSKVETNLTFLFLDGIPAISEKKHGYILNIRSGLSLCGIKHISNELAHALKDRQYPTVLNGVTHIDKRAAEILAQTPGKLRLDNLDYENCPLVLQARFFTNEFKSYSHNLKKLTPTLARTLKAATKKGSLLLNGITSLPPQCARELIGTHDLQLNGLNGVGNELAEELGKHEGALSLDTINEVSSNKLESLTKKPTRLSLRSLKSLPFDGLRHLKTRKNVTLRLFSLKNLSEAKAKELSSLPIHIVLDSGSSLTAKSVYILAQGNARFTVNNPESVSTDVMDTIQELKATNIKIDTTSELQKKFSLLKESLVPHRVIRLKNQTTFSKNDATIISKYDEPLRIVFQKRIALDVDIASNISHCICDFMFLNIGPLPDSVLSALLTHSGTMAFGEFITNEDQCKLIKAEKVHGKLEIPSYLNELPLSQSIHLKRNKRISLE